ncbi:beta-lactamase family protein [Planctobacterium marinum]|uniref:beta-lactamase family protein n=1 Tax=Planctobacterium marinum TaxID=1631968 RepID=UPI001E5F807C|nr:beta-lactamase family protein [Planctobacterium marinum]MCC2604886.1 beta-lactamase family protein [Planctobacterium marinum]
MRLECWCSSATVWQIFAPHSQYQYSNTNYLLLSRIIELSCQFRHFDFISSAIHQTPYLNATFRSVKDINTERLISGYYVGFG